MTGSPVAAVRAWHDGLSRAGRADAVRGGVGAAPPWRQSLPPQAPGVVTLPQAAPLPLVPLAEVLVRRRSSYRFGAAQPSPADLASLLVGALGRRPADGVVPGPGRRLGVAPAGGGLACLEPWLVVRGPGAVPPGVHRVQVDGVCDDLGPVGGPQLVTLRSGDPTAFWQLALDQPELAHRVPVVLALVARLDLALAKYPPRHYRTLHLDAGVAVQNLYLVATALGLPCLAVMGFDDDALAALLDLGPERFVVVLFALGERPSGGS